MHTGGISDYKMATTYITSYEMNDKLLGRYWMNNINGKILDG